MSIFSRIGNLAKGKWLVSTREDEGGPAHEASLERELAATPRPVDAARPVRGAPLRVPAGRAPLEPAANEPSSAPIELDSDGHVKRTL